MIIYLRTSFIKTSLLIKKRILIYAIPAPRFEAVEKTLKLWSECFFRGEEKTSSWQLKRGGGFVYNLRGSLSDNLRGLSFFDNLIIGSSMRPFLGNLISIGDSSESIIFLKSDKRSRDFKNDRRDFVFEVFWLNQEV